MNIHRVTRSLILGFYSLSSVAVSSSHIARPASRTVTQPLSSILQSRSYTMNVTNAHSFEKSYKAHPSVANDSFCSVPPASGNASARTLLKLEEETDNTLYTLAPNLALSRFMHQSKTSQSTLVPVSAYNLWPYAANLTKGVIQSWHGHTVLLAAPRSARPQTSKIYGIIFKPLISWPFLDTLWWQQTMLV